NLSSTRTTGDWDFGVKVNSWDEFNKLRLALLQGPNTMFKPSKILQRLIHASGIPIDLVPFGELARPDGTILWPDDEIEMTVLGFNEAFAHADWIELDKEVEIPVVSIPALVVLKFFSFADRKRIDDLRDIEFILKNYLQYENENRIFEELAKELSNATMKYEQAGPFLLGKDAGDMCSPQTLSQLLPLLVSLTNPYSDEIQGLVGSFGNIDAEEKRRNEIASLFISFREGINSIADEHYT
ncbi:MAG: nucleotidyl transferase AbiEii/AbiGii toxin family protein, partial [bacterium]